MVSEVPEEEVILTKPIVGWTEMPIPSEGVLFADAFESEVPLRPLPPFLPLFLPLLPLRLNLLLPLVSLLRSLPLLLLILLFRFNRILCI